MLLCCVVSLLFVSLSNSISVIAINKQRIDVQPILWYTKFLKSLRSRSASEAISFFHSTPRLSATGIFVTAHYWALSGDFISHLSKSHYNFILLSTPRSPKWGLPLRFPRSFFLPVYQLPITKFLAHIIFLDFMYYARP
jgi:hypothetical protein